MPALVLDVLVIAGVVTVLWARTEAALALLLVAVFVVPAPMRVPHTHSAYLTVLHVLVLAGVGRLVVRWSDGRMRRSTFAPTPMHLAWVAFVAVVFAVGVVFVVTPGGLSTAGMRLADLATQAVFFVVVLAMLRDLADLRIAIDIAAVAVVVSALVAVVEHATGSSWGRWLFAWDPSASGLDAAHPLQLREGQVRVRAGAEFALQYGWLVVTMFPVALLAVLRRRRWQLTVPAVAVLLVLAVYWSFSRSALAGMGAVVVVFAVVARERRATWLAVGGVVAGGLALLGNEAFVSHLSTGVDTGSISARFERIGPILHAVALHPFRGLGLGNLLQAGFPTTDNAFLLEYTELGAVGVAVLVVLLLLALAQTAWSIAALDDDARLVGAACTAGVVAYIAGAVFYDAFTLLQGALLLWFLVALGTVVAERTGHARAAPRPNARWLAIAAALSVGAGFGVVTVAPRHVGLDAMFTTIAPQQIAGAGDPTATGNVLAGSVCAAVALPDLLPPSAFVDCRPDPTATGAGRLHIEARSAVAVDATLQTLLDTVRTKLQITSADLFPIDPPTVGRLAVWETAPAWIPIGVLGLVGFGPWRRRRPAGAA